MSVTTIMVHREDRKWIWKLEKEQLIEKLEALDLSSTGENSVLKLRLLNAGRTATPEQILLFKNWKIEFQEEAQEIILNRWAYVMPAEECKAVLEENSLNANVSELKMRQTLTNFLSTTKDDVREDYVDLATEFFQVGSGRQSSKVTTSTLHPNKKTTAPPFNSEHSDVELNESESGDGEENNSPGKDAPLSNVRVSNQLPKLMDCVRKWGMHFSGNKNPQDAIKFVKDIQERVGCYQLDLDLMPKAMPELLKNQALEWYRNNNKSWVNWTSFSEDFISFFVPRRLKVQMEEEVIRCLQKPNQSIKEYGLQIQSLMRNIPDWDDSQTLDRIYENSRKEYKLYARRQDFKTLEEFWDLCETYEHIQKQERSISSHGSQSGRNENRTSQPYNGRGQNGSQDFMRGRKHNDAFTQNNAFLTSEDIGTVNPRPERYNPFRGSNPRETETRNSSTERNAQTKPIYTCYNCGGKGHTSRYCQIYQVPSCQRCKRKGVPTDRCGCQRDVQPLELCEVCRRRVPDAANCSCKRVGTSMAQERKVSRT